MFRAFLCGVKIEVTTGESFNRLSLAGRRHVRVALDQRETRPAAKFLHQAQVHAVLAQSRGKRTIGRAGSHR